MTVLKRKLFYNVFKEKLSHFLIDWQRQSYFKVHILMTDVIVTFRYLHEIMELV